MLFKINIGYNIMKLSHLNQLPEQTVSHNQEIKKKAMLKLGDLPHLTNFSQARFAPGQIAFAHSHRDMCEVFFIESGLGKIRINGTNYSLEAGMCIAVEPNEEHEIMNTGKQELIITYFGIQI
jgi:mannose-6-phosphate isomerase-like protein (cupin superfamily)